VEARASFIFFLPPFFLPFNWKSHATKVDSQDLENFLSPLSPLSLPPCFEKMSRAMKWTRWCGPFFSLLVSPPLFSAPFTVRRKCSTDNLSLTLPVPPPFFFKFPLSSKARHSGVLSPFLPSVQERERDCTPPPPPFSSPNPSLLFPLSPSFLKSPRAKSEKVRSSFPPSPW